MKKIISICFFVLLCSSVSATDILPYPEVPISVDEWKKYHALVSTTLVSTKREFSNHHLEGFSDYSTGAVIIFTTEDHPAYPAWVTRHVDYDENGELDLKLFGYYAGSEDAYINLYNQYRVMNEKMLKESK